MGCSALVVPTLGRCMLALTCSRPACPEGMSAPEPWESTSYCRCMLSPSRPCTVTVLLFLIKGSLSILAVVESLQLLEGARPTLCVGNRACPRQSCACMMV
jgi:hypothetical protein